MANSFQPQGTFSAGLICAVPSPLVGTDDFALLQQQLQYAALCGNFIQGAVSSNKAARDADVVKFFITLVKNTPMTLAAAQAYFPNATALCWSATCIDYKAAYTKITTTPFPVTS